MNTPDDAARHNATQNKPQKARTRRTFAPFARVAGCVALGVVAAFLIVRWRDPLALRPMMQSPLVARVLPPLPARMTRPPGMAPAAFDGFIRACAQSGINPNRIGQTIGDHPRSVGYHKRDGTLVVRGEKIDYCAATDIGVWGLTPLQTSRFCVALGRQGFAPFYRHGPKWTNGEHIHAIYALLPMKPQLRGQVREFLNKRRSDGFPRLKWEKKLRRMRRRRDDVP